MAGAVRALAEGTAWAVGGVPAWTLAEYLLHRFDMRGRRSRGTTSREHRRHHAAVDVPVITAGTWVGAALASVFLAWAIHPAAGAGGMAAYVAYELLHRHIHARGWADGECPAPEPEPLGRYGRWARAHHAHHHLVDARSNFGITTPLWDVVFRTQRRDPRTART